MYFRSGKLSDENFQPGWYLLEHHSNTSYEDLKAGMVFLQRKVYNIFYVNFLD